ncbi:MAG: aminopeptidase P family protein [Rhodospirillales bacterium]|nr:aminopeptidase P family protein [Rhodospirillales bacterium]
MSLSYRDDAMQNLVPDLEHPFTREEYQSRLGRIREQMAVQNIDLLFLTSPEAMNWVSGYQCEWYQAQSPMAWPATSGIAIHVNHDKFILFDTEREQILARYCTVSTDSRVFPPDSMRDGTSFIISELQAEGWLPGTVGLEMWSYRPNRVLSLRTEERFSSAGAKVVDATQLVRDLRGIKSKAEMDCIFEAARIADIGLNAAAAELRPGVTELEVYGAMVHAMAAAGGENPAITQPVLAGNKSAAAHAMSSRRIMEAGDVVLVDCSGVFKRYHCNMARMFSLGEPDPDVKAITEKSVGSMKLLADMIRPNLPVRELYETMKGYYEDQGIWQERGYIGGYEMGIAFPPDWVGNFVYDVNSDMNIDRVFEPGMVVNYENQFFLPHQAGLFFMIESMAFLDDEARLLSTVPYDLMVIE